MTTVPNGMVLTGDKNDGNGKVYSDDFPHLNFVLPARFWTKCKIGDRIRFKAAYTKVGATFEVTELINIDKGAIEEKMEAKDVNEGPSGAKKGYVSFMGGF